MKTFSAPSKIFSRASATATAQLVQKTAFRGEGHYGMGPVGQTQAYLDCFSSSTRLPSFTFLRADLHFFEFRSHSVYRLWNYSYQ